MAHSKCTYRVTKTTKPVMKRVLAKYTMHCQHFRKTLTLKQRQAHLHAATHGKKKPLISGNRDKKTNCPSKLTLTIKVPPQKKSNPSLNTHMALFKLDFCHNHSLHSAHSLSFQPISDSTKERIFTLFSKGHSAASARHALETELVLECSEHVRDTQRVLADRSANPTVQDYSRLYSKWRESEMGQENGPSMFAQLEREIESYNTTCKGRAMLQMYRADLHNSGNDSSDDENPPPCKKLKLKRAAQPMILAICTPLMARAHQTLRQAGELVFCDSTSSLDRFNTSVFILSTCTPASGIPLGVFITSDEQESTIKRGLEVLGEVLPANSFSGKGAGNGPSIIMTDDSSSERGALKTFWKRAYLLLCTFHFLQRKWTWLYDGKNRITKADRVKLIKKQKPLCMQKQKRS